MNLPKLTIDLPSAECYQTNVCKAQCFGFFSFGNIICFQRCALRSNTIHKQEDEPSSNKCMGEKGSWDRVPRNSPRTPARTVPKQIFQKLEQVFRISGSRTQRLPQQTRLRIPRLLCCMVFFLRLSSSFAHARDYIESRRSHMFSIIWLFIVPLSPGPSFALHPGMRYTKVWAIDGQFAFFTKRFKKRRIVNGQLLKRPQKRTFLTVMCAAVTNPDPTLWAVPLTPCWSPCVCEGGKHRKENSF